MVGAIRIGREKLREHQFKEGYARSLEGKGLKWDGDDNVEHIWKQMKRAMIESTREVCDSMKVRGRNPKCGGGTMR